MRLPVYFIIISILSTAKLKCQVRDLKVESTAFASMHYIPYRYTCDGENISPGLRVSNIPSSAKSLALILMDSTVAFGVFDHWVVWNISPDGKIPEKFNSASTGKNSNKENKYMGPCPPSGIHEYHFKVYALDVLLDLPLSSGKGELLKAMEKHVIAKGELVALFQRQ